MSLTEKIAVSISDGIKKTLKVDEEKEQIIIYGAINLFQIIFSILWVIIVGLFLGVLYEALLFSFATAILRKYSGGGHASSPSRCIIIGTALASIFAILVDKFFYQINKEYVIIVNIVFLVFAFIMIIKNAPVDSIKKPITNIEIRKQFRKKAIIVITIYLIIIVILFMLNQKNAEIYYIKAIECIGFGVLCQTITLTKSGMSFINKVDFVLKYIINGGENNE
ncbi:accessory gene regulator ArgB-like protein [Clostridium sp.]|uniref:accessory gene regulator ArgB-like protein n=1 Tax=Clostridium sp. TaxID=1506 RepID=UPI00261A9809|nr:accessory gene regulator B family protein [Clostridium sp.]